MALLEVLQFPDPRLRVVCDPIDEVGDEIRQLARDMCDVMYDEPGIGLAAPQVGHCIRFVRFVYTDLILPPPKDCEQGRQTPGWSSTGEEPISRCPRQPEKTGLNP